MNICDTTAFGACLEMSALMLSVMHSLHAGQLAGDMAPYTPVSPWS